MRGADVVDAGLAGMRGCRPLEEAAERRRVVLGDREQCAGPASEP